MPEYRMTSQSSEHLSSDELRELTGHVLTDLQVKKLMKFGIPFELDRYGGPLVRYREVRHYFLLLGKPLPREFSGKRQIVFDMLT